MGQPRTPGGQAKAGVLGAGLQTASLTITISATLGVRPRDVLEAIENMVENGTAETPGDRQQAGGKQPLPPDRIERNLGRGV